MKEIAGRWSNEGLQGIFYPRGGFFIFGGDFKTGDGFVRKTSAIPICRNILQQEPDSLFSHTCLASCYALMGSEEEARLESAEVLRVNPKFSVDYIVQKVMYKYDVDRKRLRDSLLKAGLPE